MDTRANTEKSLRYIKGKNERQKKVLLNIGDYICNRKFGEEYTGKHSQWLLGLGGGGVRKGQKFVVERRLPLHHVTFSL